MRCGAVRWANPIHSTPPPGEDEDEDDSLPDSQTPKLPAPVSEQSPCGLCLRGGEELLVGGPVGWWAHQDGHLVIDFLTRPTPSRTCSISATFPPWPPCRAHARKQALRRTRSEIGFEIGPRPVTTDHGPLARLHEARAARPRVRAIALSCLGLLRLGRRHPNNQSTTGPRNRKQTCHLFQAFFSSFSLPLVLNSEIFVLCYQSAAVLYRAVPEAPGRGPLRSPEGQTIIGGNGERHTSPPETRICARPD